MGKDVLKVFQPRSPPTMRRRPEPLLLCLHLGIPGGSTTAVLLGGLMMWGLRPGPTLFTDNPDFVWPLIASMYLGNIICLLIAFFMYPSFS